MLAFIESGVFIYVLAAIATVGIITKLVSAVRYSRLERQAEDITVTRDTYIRLWKNKFENAYRINKGMNDTDLFVERCMNQCKLLGIHLFKWDRLNRVLCSVCLVLSAAIVTFEVRSGFETGLVLGHFLTSLSICSLMVFIEIFCETGEKRQRIGLNLTDYFVNTLLHRLQTGMETVTAEADTSSKLDLREQLTEARKDNKDALLREELHREELHREDARRGEIRQDRDRTRDKDRGQDRSRDSLKESLERIAASREPEDDDRRDRRSHSKREEDVRLIEEILREYLK